MNTISKGKNVTFFRNLNYFLSFVQTATYEEIFKFLFFILASILAFFAFDAIRFRFFLIENGIPVINLSSFLIVIIGLIFIHVGKQTINSSLHDVIYANIEGSYSEQFREVRTKKILKWLYDGLYYSTTTTLSWCLFRNEPWFPAGLGGTNYSGLQQDYPNFIDTSYIIPYYMIQTANHFYALIHLAVKRREVETKYWEYMLHHTLAACLLVFSSLYNHFRVGVVVLAIHDVADIILSLSRAQHDLKSIKLLMYIQYVLLIITWVYTRVIIFPMVILESIQNTIKEPEAQLGIMYLIVQMCILFGMHLYWTYFMLQVGINVFRKGKKYEEINTYDNRELISQPKQKKNVQIQ